MNQYKQDILRSWYHKYHKIHTSNMIVLLANSLTYPFISFFSSSFDCLFLCFLNISVIHIIFQWRKRERIPALICQFWLIRPHPCFLSITHILPGLGDLGRARLQDHLRPCTCLTRGGRQTVQVPGSLSCFGTPRVNFTIVWKEQTWIYPTEFNLNVITRLFSL